MRYLKKILQLQLAVMIIGILQSCCDEKPYLHFDVLNVETPRYYKQSYLKPDSTIDPAMFYMTPFFNHNAYAGNISGVINTAFAVSPCITGEKGSKESVVRISITSTADIDSTFRAGSDLTPLFGYNVADDRRSVSDGPDSLTGIDAQYYERLRLNYGTRLWFTGNIVADTRHTFTIAVTLSDKREFKVSTGEIVFTAQSAASMAVSFPPKNDTDNH